MISLSLNKMIICLTQAFWFKKPADMLHDDEEIFKYLKHWRANCMAHAYSNTNAFVDFCKRIRKTVVPANRESTAEAKFYAWIIGMRRVFTAVDPRHDLNMMQPAKKQSL